MMTNSSFGPYLRGCGNLGLPFVCAHGWQAGIQLEPGWAPIWRVSNIVWGKLCARGGTLLSQGLKLRKKKLLVPRLGLYL